MTDDLRVVRMCAEFYREQRDMSVFYRENRPMTALAKTQLELVLAKYRVNQRRVKR